MSQPLSDTAAVTGGVPGYSRDHDFAKGRADGPTRAGAARANTPAAITIASTPASRRLTAK